MPRKASSQASVFSEAVRFSAPATATPSPDSPLRRRSGSSPPSASPATGGHWVAVTTAVILVAILLVLGRRIDQLLHRRGNADPT